MSTHHRLPPESLTWGDFDLEDRRVSKMQARHIFHDAIADHRPAVLADLAAEPLVEFMASPLCNDFDERVDLRDYLAGKSQHWYSPTPEHAHMIDILKRWGQRWHIATPWCLAHALETLDRWSERPDQRGVWWGFAGFTTRVCRHI